MLALSGDVTRCFRLHAIKLFFFHRLGPATSFSIRTIIAIIASVKEHILTFFSIFEIFCVLSFANF